MLLNFIEAKYNGSALIYARGKTVFRKSKLIDLK